MDADFDIEGLHGFIDESWDSMQGIETDFIALEQDPNDLGIINRIFRPIHSLKGNSGFFGLVNINKFAHRLENLLDQIRKGEMLVNREIIDLLLKGTEFLQEMLHRAQQSPEDTELRADEEEFLQKIEALKPVEAAGSVQSVIEFENYLHQALAIGIDLHDYSFIEGILNKIEKSNHELKKIIETHSRNEEDVFTPKNAYFYNNIDYSSKLKVLEEVVLGLAEKKPLANGSIQEIESLLNELTELFKDDTSALNELDELSSSRNFLDDQLLISNPDFNSSCQRNVQNILALFDLSSADEDGGVKKIGEILVAQRSVSAEQLNKTLGKQKKVGELLVEEGTIDKKDLDKAISTQSRQLLKAQAGRKVIAAEGQKTIRIDQAKLDTFANQIGELFINIDSFNYLKKQMEIAGTDFDVMSKFTNTVSTFDDMVEELHENVMEIRRVPVKTLFQRFPKVMRQLAQTLEKEVDFVISGEDTIIDKDLLEKIENPLVHLLRNAIDHGIESPLVRRERGKGGNSLLELKASADDNYVYLTIRDDGAGIDPLKMKEIALDKGFLSRSEIDTLTDKELVNLIFKPGFSSAKKVSDVSGRGVGMDVVLSGLNECNGTINLDSKVGKGTTVSIRIPLTKTLVAMDAMIVESAGRVYAINSDDISTTIEFPVESIGLFSEDNCVNYQGSVLRIIDVDSFFFPNAKAQMNNNNDHRKVLVVNQENKIALMVDKILNHQKIVVKDFSKFYSALQKINGISGYTVLGNEDIAMIMDINKIAEG